MKLTKRSPLLFLGLALAMMIMSACGTGSSNTQSTLTPQQVVQKSTQAMANLNTSHVDFNASLQLNGLNAASSQIPANVTITLKGSGDQSFPDKQQQLNVTFGYNNNLSVQASTVMTSDKAYIKLQGPWYVLDKAQFDQAGLTSSLFAGTPIDESSLLNLLNDVSITDHGDQNLNGQSLRHITANMNKDAFQKVVSANPQLSSLFSSQDMNAITNFSASVDVYIDETSFYLHHTELKVNLGTNVSGASINASLDLTIDLSKFNQSVTITVPTNATPLTDPQQLFGSQQ